MNEEAFRGTPYQLTRDALRDRNKRLIKKNRRAFSLFIDPHHHDRLVGYSCILPLTAGGVALYLSGQLSDAQFQLRACDAPGRPTRRHTYFRDIPMT